MSQNQEIIEAKLCAYIDNELDPEARAEIEKHLESNPQHRRLIESLKVTRDLVRGLPRESAPPELAEALNGQLERSVLLDGPDGGDSLRLRPWPRYFAAAAIVLLTAGLGLAVYAAIPRLHGRSPWASLLRHGPKLAASATSPSDSSVLGVPSGATTGPLNDEARLAKRAAGQSDFAIHQRSASDPGNVELALLAQQALQDPNVQDRLFGSSSTSAGNNVIPSNIALQESPGNPSKQAEPDSLVAGRRANSSREVQVDSAAPASPDRSADAVAPSAAATTQQTPTAGGVGEPQKDEATTGAALAYADNTVGVVVRADNPDQVDERLHAYFKSNGIQWEAATEPMPPALKITQSQELDASVRNNTQSRMLRSGLSETPQESGVDSAKAKPDIAARMGNLSRNANGGESRVNAKTAGTQPSGNAESEATPSQELEQQQRYAGNYGAANTQRRFNRVVAARMTRRQYVALNSALAAENSNEPAGSEQGVAHGPDAPAHEADNTSAGAALTQAPSTSAMNSAQKPAPPAARGVAPQTRPATSASPQDMAAVPMMRRETSMARMRDVGRAPQTERADKSSLQAGPATRPSATFDLGARPAQTPPTTQPSRGLAGNRGAIVSEKDVASESLQMHSQATAPAPSSDADATEHPATAPDTEAADETVNVVIAVEAKAEEGQPAESPTTQPAAEPETGQSQPQTRPAR